jgi:ribosomal protein L37E
LAIGLRLWDWERRIMADVAHSAQHEFWRPPMPAATSATGHHEMVEACNRCGTEFIVDSRFCHSCGAVRRDLHRSTVSQLREQLTLAHFIGLGDRLGLSTPAFVAFAVGVLCLIGALGVGMIFSARTVLDWQAVQLWRIEWLLAAVAAFVAGCLLKKTR